MQVSKAAFGEYKGRPITKYIIASDSGMQASVINYGATVTNLMVPNAH